MGNKLKNKFIIGIITIIMLGIVIVMAILGTIYRNSLIDIYEDKTIEISHEVAAIFDGDEIFEYANNPIYDERYESLENALNTIKIHTGNIKLLYVFVPISNRELICIFDIYTAEEQSASYVEGDVLGQKCTYEQVGFNEVTKIYSADSDYPVAEVCDTSVGRLICGYAPVFGQDGKVKAIVATGYDMQFVNQDLANYLYIMTSVLLILGFIICLAIIVYSDILLLRPLTNASQKVQQFFIEKLNVNNNYDESNETFTKQANHIMEAMGRLMEENKEMKNTLDIHGKYASFTSFVQSDMLDRTLVRKFENEAFTVIGDIHSEKDFAGDFYDCYKINSDKYIFTLASVMERNIAAALYMSFARLLLRDNSLFEISPDEVLDITNNQLVIANDTQMFIRAFMSEFDIEKKILRYSSAAGIIPLVIRKDGKLEKLNQSKEYMPIGAWEDTPYELSEISLNSGDIIVMYNRHSDSKNSVKAEYETEKLAEIVTENIKSDDDNPISTIVSEIKKYRNVDTMEYAIMIILVK